MTHSSRRTFVVASAALVAGAIACSGRPPTRAVEPTSAPVASDADPETAASPGESRAVETRATGDSSEAATSEETADDVVTLIAKPGLWPLDVEAARRVLQAFGPVTQQQRGPNDLSLVGGHYGALDRFDIAYTLEEQQYWAFGSAGFVLDDRDPTRLFHSLQTRLTQLLGKPARTSRGAATDGAVVWDLGEAWLTLAPSDDQGLNVVVIRIHENKSYEEEARKADQRAAQAEQHRGKHD